MLVERSTGENVSGYTKGTLPLPKIMGKMWWRIMVQTIPTRSGEVYTEQVWRAEDI